MPETWNSADKTASVVLSNSDKTATLGADSGFRGVRGTGPVTTGKVHVEFKTAGTLGASWGFGLANASYTFPTECLVTLNAIIVNVSGQLWRNTQIATPITLGIVAGAWNAMEVDFDAKTIKFWNASVYSTPVSFSAMTGPFYLLMDGGSTGAATEINTGQSAFVITPSTGFEAGWGAPVAPVVPGVSTTGGAAFWDQDDNHASRKRRKKFLNERAARLARL
jgi:hypothetical protein